MNCLERSSLSPLTNFEVHQYWHELPFASNILCLQNLCLSFSKWRLFLPVLFLFLPISYFVKHYFILIFFLDYFFHFYVTNSVISIERNSSVIKFASVYEIAIKMKSKIN